jgi:hypothetical protein
MATNTPRRLYISVLTNDRAHLPPHVRAFVEGLEARGFSLFMPFDHIGYDNIEREIDQSDGFVALVDQDWFDATCTACEICHALEDCGYRTVPNHRPVPTFIYWYDQPYNLAYLQRPSQEIYLPRDVPAAVEAICAFFEQRDQP